MRLRDVVKSEIERNVASDLAHELARKKEMEDEIQTLRHKIDILAESKQKQDQETSLVADNMWCYRDLDGKVFGPYRSETMRKWMEDGYFNGNLEVRGTKHVGWKTLRDICNGDLSVAFL